jgi:hypothetical protein
MIRVFPINDDPVLFGLHNNADISYAQAETYACLATLLSLQPRDIGSSVSKLDEITSQLAKNILNELPKPFNLKNIQKKYTNFYTYLQTITKLIHLYINLTIFYSNCAFTKALILNYLATFKKEHYKKTMTSFSLIVYQ